MSYKYGIFHSSETACILYKRDTEGDNQSIFDLNILPQKDGEMKRIHLFIDNDQVIRIGGSCLIPFIPMARELTTGDVYDEFGKWYDGTDLDFDLKARNSIRHLLKSELKVVEISSEKEGELGINTGIVNVKINDKKDKNIKLS